MELKFTQNNFKEEVIQSSIPVLVDFYAEWCGPCKMMGPVVEKLAEEYQGKIKIGKCNIDDNPELTSQYRVMSVPTFIIFKDGKQESSISGAVSKNQLEDKIKQVLDAHDA